MLYREVASREVTDPVSVGEGLGEGGGAPGGGAQGRQVGKGGKAGGFAQGRQVGKGGKPGGGAQGRQGRQGRRRGRRAGWRRWPARQLSAAAARAARQESPAAGATTTRAVRPATLVVCLAARAGWRAARRQLPAARAICLAARRRRPEARAICLAATYGGEKGSHAGTSMADKAAMAVDGGNANGEAPVAHAVEGDGPDVERSTDPEMLRQFRPSGMFYAHVGLTGVIDRVPVIADQGLYDICIRNRARAHTRRLHAPYEALPGFVDVLAENGSPSHADDRVAEVHGDPFFGNPGPHRRIYEVMSFCNEVIRYQVPLHPFIRLVYTNALLFLVRGPRPSRRQPTSFAACCRTSRRPSCSGSRWPRTSRSRLATRPVWRSTWTSLRWWWRRSVVSTTLVQLPVY